MMDLASFNAAPPDEARAVVAPCADIGTWVEAVVSGRPYDDVDSLLRRAGDLAARWSPSEVDAALADHPRIGERHGGTGASARLSLGEQSTLEVDAARREALVIGNAEYEKRFGRVFLIRAAGRTADEILAELTRRLANDPAAESRETTAQLREIALLRLDGAVR